MELKTAAEETWSFEGLAAPHLVAQITCQELTADRKLRQPVYLGLREDKRVKDVTLPRRIEHGVQVER
jgi:ATP-dependent DNA ligase